MQVSTIIPDSQPCSFWSKKEKDVRGNESLQKLFDGLHFPVRDCHLLQNDEGFWKKIKKNATHITEQSKAAHPLSERRIANPAAFDRRIQCAQNPWDPSAFAFATLTATKSYINSDGFGCFDIETTFNKEVTNAHCFCVLDGHGDMGALVSDFVKKTLQQVLTETMSNLNTEGTFYSFSNALTVAFVKLDSLLKRERYATSGTTLCLAAIVSDQLFIANCGDTRAVLGKGFKQKAIPLSLDYNTDIELTRKTALKRGGVLFDEMGAWRVDGQLMLTRAIGNEGMMSTTAEKPISARPKINVVSLNSAGYDQNSASLVIATDGLFDVISSDDCVEFACNSLEKGHMPDMIAKSLVQIARNRHSSDDITALVLPLKRYLKEV